MYFSNFLCFASFRKMFTRIFRPLLKNNTYHISSQMFTLSRSIANDFLQVGRQALAESNLLVFILFIISDFYWWANEQEREKVHESLIGSKEVNDHDENGLFGFPTHRLRSVLALQRTKSQFVTENAHSPTMKSVCRTFDESQRSYLMHFPHSWMLRPHWMCQDQLLKWIWKK